MNYRFIAIEGNIGVGKTTLAKAIAKHLDAKLILEEFAENPLLPLFYNDPKKYSFPLEMSFMAERYEQLKVDLANLDLFNPIIVADYLVDKSLLFSKVNLNEQEFLLYQKFFQYLFKSIRLPDLVIYLHQPVNQLLENIKNRGRSYENTITKGYLNNLESMYFDFMKKNNRTKFVIINRQSLDFDFVNNKQDVDTILKILEREYSTGINFYSRD